MTDNGLNGCHITDPLCSRIKYDPPHLQHRLVPPTKMNSLARDQKREESLTDQNPRRERIILHLIAGPGSGAVFPTLSRRSPTQQTPSRKPWTAFQGLSSSKHRATRKPSGLSTKGYPRL
ncbi:hypothetical protein AVEN_214250-1 [Araneus ventricosus]|uniref:Uncharacterized protein n=1 Tax=Araneus ventricosus TaxID=182803 RepID=A0A4Y2NFU1_ARAVE|nr:hypothetical protein AVEN_214250-1 [Araneus ventricosus]